MSFYKRVRHYSTTAIRGNWANCYASYKPSLGYPSPPNEGPLLNSPELVKLAEKARGPWASMTTEEAIQLYRANFSMTFKEMRASPGHYKYVIPALIGTTVLSYFLFVFTKENFGPITPHTMNNPEWDKAFEEWAIKHNIEPITGISAKHRKKMAEEAKKAGAAK